MKHKICEFFIPSFHMRDYLMLSVELENIKKLIYFMMSEGVG